MTTYDLAFKMRPKTKEEIRKVLIETAERLNYGPAIDWNNTEQKKYYIQCDNGHILNGFTKSNKNASDIFCTNFAYGTEVEKILTKEDIQFYYTTFVNLLGYDVIHNGKILKREGEVKIVETNKYVSKIAGAIIVVHDKIDVVGLPEPKIGTFYIVSNQVFAAVNNKGLAERRYDLLAPNEIILGDNKNLTEIKTFYAFDL